MKKIKIYLTILPMLLLPVSVLASQEEPPVCKMRWGGVIPKIRCLAQPFTVKEIIVSNTEKASASSALMAEELRRLRKMTLFL